MDIKKLNEELEKYILNELSDKTKQAYIAGRQAQVDAALAELNKAKVMNLNRLKRINESLHQVLEYENNVWNIIHRLDLMADNCFDFFFYRGASFKITPEITQTFNQTETYLVENERNFGLFYNGKQLYSLFSNPKVPDTLEDCSKAGYYIYKINEKPRKLSKLDKDAIELDLRKILESYGSYSIGAQKYMEKFSINPHTVYVYQKYIMASSTPNLRYDFEKQQFTCIIGKHGKGFYRIPITQFNSVCKPETEEDIDKRIFIAAQD